MHVRVKIDLALPPVTERNEHRERADECKEDEDKLKRLAGGGPEPKQERHQAPASGVLLSAARATVKHSLSEPAVMVKPPMN